MCARTQQCHEWKRTVKLRHPTCLLTELLFFSIEAVPKITWNPKIIRGPVLKGGVVASVPSNHLEILKVPSRSCYNPEISYRILQNDCLETAFPFKLNRLGYPITLSIHNFYLSFSQDI